MTPLWNLRYRQTASISRLIETVPLLLASNSSDVLESHFPARFLQTPKSILPSTYCATRRLLFAKHSDQSAYLLSHSGRSQIVVGA